MVVVKRLFLGLLLITGTSAILLISDLGRRQADGNRIPRVALLQYATSPLMDEGARGMRDGLKENRFMEGEGMDFTHYNCEGDMPTANVIASEIAGGRFDLILTLGTPAMQAVANANKGGKTPHLFGLVADPAGAGVGIDRQNPLDHPAHMVGIGSLVSCGNG